MRAAFITAALAAVAVAVPLENEKRAVVVETDYDVAYVTQYYTVQGGQQAKPTPEAKAKPWGNWGHGSYGGRPNWWGGGKPNKGHKHKHKKPSPKPSPKPQPTYAPKPPQPKPTGKPGKPPGKPPGGPVPNSYPGKAVYHHNIHRANHSAPHIKWDTGLAATAQKIADSCVYAHNTEMDGGGYGQNIAAGVDASGIDQVITNMFYNGEVNYYTGLYGQADPDMSLFEKWGHFSQIVWKDSTHVGCATKACSSLANVGSNVPPYFTVCNYAGPGNFAGEYGDNVGEPLGHATVNA